MFIQKVYIENFKCFKGKFSIEFTDGANILVGNNEVGKSTILEAVHLALSGLLNGQYLRNELSQYLFNNEVVSDFINSVKSGQNPELPYIKIEVFFAGNNTPKFEGDGNSDKSKAAGICFKIEFENEYKEAYEEILKTEFETIPIEFYKISWKSFSRDTLTAKSIPLKSVIIDSSSHRYFNGSDIYISRIIKNNLNDKQRADISQAFRKLKETFMADKSIKVINEQVKKDSNLSSSKVVEISVDLSSRDAWESTLMTYLDRVPFQNIGKGEQCIVKTNLSLSHKKSDEANLILFEEPENHLTHSKLNEFLNSIISNFDKKQIIISTHSSFVANKLGLENLILLSINNDVKERGKFYFKDLDETTQKYFKKLSGYDTLRLILCRKAILVEGDSDELLVQKAYMDANKGKLPIENRIDVISVRRLAFKRFLQIAKELKQPTAVVTDNDGNYRKNIIDKYADYEDIDGIEIFADNREKLETLEPQLVDANKNQLPVLCKAIGVNEVEYNTAEKLVKYMSNQNNKTRWALNVFETQEKIKYPSYIEKVIAWCDEK
jgi:putative ATP-dependent endonuclease of the OLD family